MLLVKKRHIGALLSQPPMTVIRKIALELFGTSYVTKPPIMQD